MDESITESVRQDAYAEGDLEQKLQRFYELRDTSTKAKAEYEALRDELAPILLEEGTRYVMVNGEKYYAYAQPAEQLVVAEEVLEQEVDTEVWEAVTETHVVNAKFLHAVETGRIPKHVAQKVMRFKPRATSVKFGDPDKPPR